MRPGRPAPTTGPGTPSLIVACRSPAPVATMWNSSVTENGLAPTSQFWKSGPKVPMVVNVPVVLRRLAPRERRCSGPKRSTLLWWCLP